MNQIDVYYRALLDYRAQTTAYRDCEKLNQAFSRIGENTIDVIKVSRAECTVDEEWVRRIEQGLVHIEKAIKEERQFIRSNGEVIPIEKVRHVSKESVEHLAKHSNLLTRKPEAGKDIIPDQLYTVERLNDYAVYENRFLYMLLCYLRDFITLRYNNIMEIVGRYEGEIKVEKEVTVGKQKLTYSVYMHDERRDDEYLREHNSSKHNIDRISLILKTVLAFLNTPLMEYSAKAPLLKPPITKTNVLKMNNNFKGAVALYDYIITYDKPGYSVEYIVNEMNPYEQEVAEEVSEAGIMLSFLTYEHGLGIENDLKAAYEEEELIRRAIEIKQKQEELEMMKLRLAKAGENIEEYTLALEKQVKLLLHDNERIEPLERELEELKAIETALRDQVTSLEIYLAETKAAMLAQEQEFLRKIAQMEEEFVAELARIHREHEDEIIRINAEHQVELDKVHTAYLTEIQNIKSEHVAEIQQLIEDYTAEIDRLMSDHKEELQRISDEHIEYVDNLKAEHEAAVERLKANYEADKARLEKINAEITEKMDNEIANLKVVQANKIEELSATIKELEAELSQSRSEFDDVTAEKCLTEARLVATRAANGLIGDEDFTDRDRFNELEREYTAFMKFYDEQWKKVKKKIRQEALSAKNLRKQKNKDVAKEDAVAAEEVANAATEEMTEIASEEAAIVANEAIAESAPEEVVNAADEEAAEPASEEVVNAADEEAVEPASEEVVNAADEEAVEPASEEAANAADEEAVEPASEEVANVADEEVVEPASEEVANAADEEVVEPASEEVVNAADEETTPISETVNDENALNDEQKGQDE